MANRERGHPEFEWQFVSEYGGLCRSSSGIPIMTGAFPPGFPDVAILLAPCSPDRVATEAALTRLRQLVRHGCLLGCVDTGALVFAKAGLLQVRPAAAHPEAVMGFCHQFPSSLFMDRMVDFSPPRFSSAGGVATLDMTLALIARFTSNRIVRRLSEIPTNMPTRNDNKRATLPSSIPAQVRDAVSIMDANCVNAIPVPRIAEQMELPMWMACCRFRGRQLKLS